MLNDKTKTIMTKLIKIGSENVRLDRIESVQDYTETNPHKVFGYRSSFKVTMMSGKVYEEWFYNQDDMICEQESDDRIEFIISEIEKL